MRTINDCQIIQLPKIPDHRGNLSFFENNRHIPFDIQRVYWIYDVPGGEMRSEGHAYMQLQEFIVALSGSFDVVLDDGYNQKTYVLNRSYFGLYIPNLIWRQIQNFSTNAFCMIAASLPFAEDDYIRDYRNYLETRNTHTK